MGLKLKTAPANYAMWLSDAKAHLRIRHDGDNRDVLLAIQSATAWAENYAERSLITRTYELGLDAFADEIEMPMPPLVTVNAVQYYDTAGALQTLDAANYHVDDMSNPGRIVPVSESSWPGIADRPNAVIVDFDAGYGTSPLNIPPRHSGSAAAVGRALL